MRAWTLLLFLLVALGVSTPAWAEVTEAQWTELVGQPVLLTNSAGKQIRGTLAAADGDTITVVREDGKRVTVTKAEVATAIYTGPPPPEPAVVEPPVVEPAVVEPAVVEPAVVEPAVVEPAVVEPSEPVAVDPAPATETPPAAAVDPRESAIAGEVEGRAAAQETGVGMPLGLSAGVGACASAGACAVCGPAGPCIAVPVAVVAPAAMGVIKPQPDPVALRGHDDAYAQAYTIAYQTELRRRRAIWGAVGAGIGLAAGGTAGLIGFYYMNGGTF